MTGFDQFWTAYPRRKGKGEAEKAFRKAMQLVDLDTILTAVDAYKREHEYLLGRDGWVADYKHPATWLRAKCWEDDYECPPTAEEIEQRRQANLARYEEARKRWGMS